jgi:hypothetical protein
LQDGVTTGQLSQKAAIPVSNEQITKAEANTYVNIDTSFAPYAAKASNQLVVKSNLISRVAINSILNTIFFGIANNQTTISPIQLISGWNTTGLTRGIIYRSTDFGNNYSLTPVLDINRALYRIKFMPSFRHASYLTVPPFVSVGVSGRIVTNSVTDATSWITITSPTTQDLYDISFNSSVGIIVGNNRIIKTNTNNRINAWSIVNSVTALWRAVASDGSRFVAVGDNSSIIAGNSLGTTWTTASMPPLSPSNVSLRGITFHTDSFFYAVGYTVSNNPFIMRSSDSGFNWSLYNPTGDSFIGPLLSISSINGRLVIGGENYQYLISSNVITRINATFTGFTYSWNDNVKQANSNGFQMVGIGPTGGAISTF